LVGIVDKKIIKIYEKSKLLKTNFLLIVCPLIKIMFTFVTENNKNM